MHKKYRLILSGPVFLFLTVVFFPVQGQIPGDTNGDNSVNIIDALITAQYSVGLDPSPFYTGRADVNCDNSINILDALMIAQYYVGAITNFPCTLPSTPSPIETPPPLSTPVTQPAGDSVPCAGYPVWNSGVVYGESGTLVQYNCNLYRNNYFSYNQNPEESYVDQYSVWVLQGSCNDDCRMGEGPWVACGQWDKWTNGGYTLYNNIWGDGAGSQCIRVESYSNWGVTADHPDTGGVKSYPNASKTINRALGTLSRLSSSFDVTVPDSGSYATTYDIWAGDHQYEIMIWVNYTGAVGPIAGSWSDEGDPVAEATGVSLGGHTWNVYKGNIGFTVISFLRTTGTNSGTINIKAIMDYIYDRGWFGDVVIGEAQFGFEITSAAGGLDFTCNSYSME